MATKYIFVTGGVVSGLGKGITAASIGRILKARGLKVKMQKLDPYINIDPGTMSPYQHGEVFVTEDGGETDLDIGHYERFIDENLDKFSNVTAGKIYKNVLEKEREGKYLGDTIQVIPHITNEIKECIYRDYEKKKIDVVITEIGGTVGDIESLPFIEAIRQVIIDKGRENTLYVHVTLIPFISSSEEIKTKPTQHSVKELMKIGIVPDVIVCRTSKHLKSEHKEKIALFCNISKEAVFENYDLKSIYEAPLMFEEQKLGDIICKRMNIKKSKCDLKKWNELVNKFYTVQKKDESVTIALVGKYIEMKDAYLSYSEALNHSSVLANVKVNINWVSAEELEKVNDVSEVFKNVNGIIIAGGFGVRGIEGKIKAIEFARTNNIPMLGVCLGMQLMAIEFARNVLGYKDATSSEFDENAKHLIIDIMAEQKNKLKGGTMRLGAFPCKIKKGTLAHKIYGKELISERHRHRYEFNNKYISEMEEKGFVVSGVYEEATLVEISEIVHHPFMIGVQFHPELKSRITNPHPLYLELVKASKKYKYKK